MSNARKGSTPNKLGLRQCKTKLKTTTDNRTYKIARLFEYSVSCIVCMGRCCGEQVHKRNNGQKPSYKNINRKSIKNITII